MSEHQQEELSPKGVLKTVVIGLVGTILAMILLVLIAQNLFRGSPEMDEATADNQTVARIKPVGDVTIGEAQAPVGSRSGEAVYKTVCASCHDQGVGGAPKTGDAASWTARIAKGFATLVEHALHGFNAMPAKGGGPDLTEDEIKRAVAFMANKSGANFSAPEVKAEAGGTPTQPAAASVATATTSTASGASAGVKGADSATLTTAANAAQGSPAGKTVYDASCFACHGTGAGGAPKVGDKAEWASRIAQGNATLYKHAIGGFQGKKGMMPPKGGSVGLSDAEVKSAVDYMVSASK